MNKIKHIIGYELLDSRGNPTTGCRVISDSGKSGFAIVPSGASTGKHEAFELRDNDNHRFHGKGVTKAVANIEGPLFEAVQNKGIFEQEEIDQAMIDLDGSDNKSNLGANAILAISMATARLAANTNEIELHEYLHKSDLTLPTPMMNIINGGAHADNNIDFQEFMICPHGIDSFAEKIRAGSEVFHSLKKILKNKGLNTSVGDEGGFAPNLGSAKEALELIIQAIEQSGYTPGKDLSITLDCAASDFYAKDGYFIEKNHPELGMKSSSDQVQYLKELASSYPIISIEDGLDENDWDGWKIMTKELGNISLVGDDIFVTNKSFLQRGIDENVANSILIKPNQIGTVTETLDTIKLAKDHNYSYVISHRSGDSEDPFIADLAVATKAPYIKTGSMCRSERICKYNRLLEIEKNASKK